MFTEGWVVVGGTNKTPYVWVLHAILWLVMEVIITLQQRWI